MKDRFGIDWSKARGSRFWKRPHLSRRVFFRHTATALGGYFLMPSRPMENVAQAAASPIGKAKFCIFVLMTGAPSHVDSFDLKTGPWLPASFDPTTYDGVIWPRGLFPRLGDNFDNVSLVRSIKPWAAVHGLAQSWLQIGRNPTSQLAKIAPHIGSVVSLEMASRPGNKTLPGFIALNSASGPSQGYLAPDHAPFYVANAGGGLPNTTFSGGQAMFERRFPLAIDLDEELRGGTLGAASLENELVNANARKLMYNPDITKAFTADNTERVKYGNSGFGNACITARNLIRADMGTRFLQINVGSWDLHANIYQTGMNPTNAASLGRQFDAGLGTLIEDLRKENLLDQTLIVAMGEFGRTIGALNTTGGRDHFLQQAALFAGAGIRGRKAIGSTDDRGAATADPGWSRQRDIRAEDIEATIYSAMGIDWTTIRRDDPFGRGFEYVPQSGVADEYAPIHELWG